MTVGLFLYFPLFLFAVFLAFFIPGNIFIKPLRLTNLQTITLSLSFGIILWALQGYMFGYLHARWMTYLYLMINLVLWIKIRKPLRLSKPKIAFRDKQNILFVVFIIFCVVSQLSMTFFNGITTQKGIYFCCGTPDSLTHIAITNELIKTFPPYEPDVSECF